MGRLFMRYPLFFIHSSLGSPFLIRPFTTNHATFLFLFFLLFLMMLILFLIIIIIIITIVSFIFIVIRYKCVKTVTRNDLYRSKNDHFSVFFCQQTTMKNSSKRLSYECNTSTVPEHVCSTSISPAIDVPILLSRISYQIPKIYRL